MRLVTLCLGLTLSLAPVLAACSQIPEASASSTSALLIKRGDRNLAFHVTPGKPGNDTYIVLDAGGGLDASYWNDFVPTLSQRTGATLITYDRAGMGRSDEAPGPWDLNEATRDLEHGLEKLHATRNVILVSHSLAGEIATALVGRHPDWFTGGVLVDANVPDVYTEDFISRSQAIYAPVLVELRAAPPTAQGRQLLALSESFVETSRAFHKMVWPSSVPATVIAAERPPFESEVDAQWWKNAHAQFARGAGNRRLVAADRSSHDVVRDRPEVILDAIIELSQRADRH